MDNKIITKIIKTQKLSKYKKIPITYKYKNVSNYTKLTPLSYTILLKNTKVVTNINKKKESHINLKRGDYVLCGIKNEKYGLPLEKILNIYELGNIESKPVIRKGFKLTKKNTNKPSSKSQVRIVPDWGGEQTLQIGDYILLTLDEKKHYGIEKKALKKTYKKL